MITTHRFASTTDAYTASQTDESIRNGDVLVVESERVVDVLVDAWHVAITPERGAFHTFAPDVDISAFGACDEQTCTYTVHPVDGEPYEHTETTPAKPARDLTPSVDVARAIVDALWGEHDDVEHDPAEQHPIVPTHEPITPEGVELASSFPAGTRVAFDFAPEPDLPEGLSGDATIVGVVESVVDDGDGESGPHVSMWAALALWHDGVLYTCHPDDGMTSLRAIA